MPYTNLSITISTGLSYAAGDFIQVSYDASNYAVGEVVSYNPTTGALVMTPTLTVGSGTYAAWSVNLTGVNGTLGTSGTSATSGSTAAATRG